MYNVVPMKFSVAQEEGRGLLVSQFLSVLLVVG